MPERDRMRTEYRVNCDPGGIIPRIRNFCLDMDGTVYLDNLWIDGAKDFLAKLTATGRKYCFMTNNSSKSASIYVEKLLNMGLVIDPEKQLITSGHATVDYLKRKYPGKRVYLFGNPMVKMEFEERGVLIDEEHPDITETSAGSATWSGRDSPMWPHTRISTARRRPVLFRTSDRSAHTWRRPPGADPTRW